MPDAHQLVHVLLMYLVDVIVVWVRVLHHPDRATDNDVDGSPVRHHAYVVVEDTPRVEDGHRKAHELLDEHLELVYVGMRIGIELVVDVVFAEGEDRDEVGAGAYGHLDKALAAVEDELYGTGARIEGFTCAAYDDGDGAAHAFVVITAFGEDVFAGLARYGGHAETKGVFAIDGVAEVGIEGQQGVGDAREELRKAKGFRCKGSEGAMGDDAMWVVAEDVLPSRLQLLGAM